MDVFDQMRKFKSKSQDDFQRYTAKLCRIDKQSGNKSILHYVHFLNFIFLFTLFEVGYLQYKIAQRHPFMPNTVIEIQKQLIIPQVFYITLA